MPSIPVFDFVDGVSFGETVLLPSYRSITRYEEKVRPRHPLGRCAVPPGAEKTVCANQEGHLVTEKGSKWRIDKHEATDCAGISCAPEEVTEKIA